MQIISKSRYSFKIQIYILNFQLWHIKKRCDRPRMVVTHKPKDSVLKSTVDKMQYLEILSFVKKVIRFGLEMVLNRV